MIKRMIDKLASSRIIWAVCAVIVAVVFWNYVAKEENVTRKTYVVFDIIYENGDHLTSDDLELASSVPNQVRLWVEGSFNDVAKIQEKPVITIDLSTVSRQGAWDLNFQVKSSGVSSSSVSVTTDEGESFLSISVVKVKSKRVDVRLNKQIVYTVADGYSVDTDGITIDPEAINITGPEEIINKVEYAQVEEYTSEGLKNKTFEETVPIKLVVSGGTDGEEVQFLSAEEEAQLTIDKSTVKVTFPITVTREVELKANVSYEGSGLTEDNVEITLNKTSVVLSGPVEAMETIGDTYSIGDIDLRDPKYAKYSTTVGEVMNSDMEHTETFTVSYPDNVTPDGTKEVTATIKISGVSTKTITATQISTTNVPDGYSAEIQTSEVTLVIRAPSDQINQIGDSNIRVVADLSTVDISGSSLLLSPTVYIDGVTNAGTLTLENSKVRVKVTRTG